MSPPTSSPTEKERGKRKEREKKEEMAGVRALVVDDDQLTRRLMERMLIVSLVIRLVCDVVEHKLTGIYSVLDALLRRLRMAT